MTLGIAAVLAILAVSLVLFVTEKLRMDVVALAVLSTLALTGLVTPTEALSGFSNPAVVTVWAMFVLSAGLSATGVADIIGRRVLRIAGTSEPRIIFTVMLATGTMSAFMNNIGVAALMLPVVMDIARRTQTSPSRLLMPMAYASLLGGLTTLVGTPPNLVASDVLREHTGAGFSLFEFTPVGGPALIVGSLFVALVGRHLLPKQMPESLRQSMGEAGTELRFTHRLDEARFLLMVGAGSPLHRCPLRETGLSTVLGIQVHAVSRGSKTFTEIDGDFVLEAGDRLHVLGRVEDVRDFAHWNAFGVGRGAEIPELLALERLVLVSALVAADSELVGLSVRETDFHGRFGGHIVTIRRDDQVRRDGLADFVLAAGDELRVELKRESLPELDGSGQFDGVEIVTDESLAEVYPENHELLQLDVPDDSRLSGLSIAESGISGLHLRIIGIGRRSGSIFLPGGDLRLERGDKLLVHGTKRSIELMRALQSLELVETGANDAPELAAPGDLGFSEVTLAPGSSLVGRTPREVNFRRRYNAQVVSIWRSNRAYRSHLRNIKLQFGDVLLLSGARKAIGALTQEPDFLILSSAAYERDVVTVSGRTWVAGLVMLAVVFSVLAGILPIAIAAVTGGVVMVISRCLSMDDAYRAIEWKSVFLIACMIPLGTAMQSSGAAAWLGQGMAAAAAPLGPWGLIAGLYLLTALATTIVPTAALVVIMAQVGLDACRTFDTSPKLVVMAIALAASASFTSPISHPANVLVMGPGGYRFVDYVKLGVFLALIVMLTVLPMLAWMW